MSDWTSGYVVDVSYTHGFYKELAPSFLSFAALVQGYAAPGLGTEPLTYCELGCGQGVSANLLASANPHVEFYAKDFNPAHIAGARDLARAARLSNVNFFEDSFAEFALNRQLPTFDMIALHGIYSWISEENRSHIVRFVREKLKPGGLVYHLLQCHAGLGADHAAPSSHDRVRGQTGIGLDPAQGRRIRRVCGTPERGESEVLHREPESGQSLARSEASEPILCGARILQQGFTPFYFSDITRELAGAKLNWIGSANVLDSIDPINLSEAQQQLLAEIDDVGLRQTVRDHMIDQQFRRDIFVKGPVPLTNPAAKERWLETRFASRAPGRTSRARSRHLSAKSSCIPNSTTL